MNIYRTLLILMLFSAPALAYQFPTEIIEKFDDKRIVAFVNESHFTDAKHWNPLEEAPPLTVAGAIVALKQHYLADHKSLGNLMIKEIEIRQTPLHKGLWHYIIKAQDNGKNFFSFVLMNGMVIPAIVEPESYK